MKLAEYVKNKLHERYVRDKWYRPIVDDYCGRISIRFVDCDYWPEEDYESADLAWEAAAEFTLERIEEIRQVEIEIGMIERQIACAPEFDEAFKIWSANDIRNSAANIFRWSRILAREQAALAELKTGMK